jgi:hypothetical protein
MDERYANAIAEALRQHYGERISVWYLGGMWGVAIDTDAMPRGSVAYLVIGADCDSQAVSVWYEDHDGVFSIETGEEVDMFGIPVLSINASDTAAVVSFVRENFPAL